MSKANKSIELLFWEKVTGKGRSHKQEQNTTYNGERPSPFSFIFQFPEVIFRKTGSVAPNIIIEMLLSVGISIASLYLVPDETWSPVGHQIVGVLLAFLVVFRSNSAMAQYTEGRNHVESLLDSTRCVASAALATVIHVAEIAGAEDKDKAEEADLSKEAAEIIRLLKLYFYAVIEHVRSTEGFDPWFYAQDQMHFYATRTEVQTFRAEFGPPQRKGRRIVAPDNDVKTEAELWQEPKGEQWGDGAAFKLKRNGMVLDAKALVAWNEHASPAESAALSVPPGLVIEHNVPPFERAFKKSKFRELSERVEVRYDEFDEEEKKAAAQRYSDAKGRESIGTRNTTSFFRRGTVAPHDPTRAKALLVHIWLRSAVARLEAKAVKTKGGSPLKSASKHLDNLLTAKTGIDKVDDVVLPLPYCQLLKVFQIAWVFSLPVVLVQEVGYFLPGVMLLVSCAFFGLDSVGAELEAPFGVDANDYPLLHWGIDLAEDLDVMTRQTYRTLYHLQPDSKSKPTPEEVEPDDEEEPEKALGSPQRVPPPTAGVVV